jgi:hypothetical protein
MLQVENLAKTYAMRFTALEGVNLEVEAGEIVAWSSRRSAPCTSTGAGSPAPRATWVSSSRSRG